MKALALLTTLLVFQANAQQPAHKYAPPRGRAYLDVTIATLENALNQYQSQEAVTANGLPPLASAEFDFKTVTQNSVSGEVDVFVFSVSGKHSKTHTDDLVFTFVPKKQANLTRGQVDDFAKELIDVINKAAEAVRTSPQPASVGELGIDKVSITISFAVENEVGGGLKFPINILTFGAKLDHDKASTQQVKLTFERPQPKGS